MSYAPTIIETTARGERAMDIHSRLLKERIVMVNGEIDDELSDNIVAQLLFLELNNPEKLIRMYINSPGGSVTAGMAIYDVMNYVKPEIETVVIGQAASMGSVLAQSGTQCRRHMMPNARLMIHQPLGSVSGSVSDAEIAYKEMLHYKQLIAEVYANHNAKNHDAEYFLSIMDRDTYIGATESIELGLIDSVVVQRPMYGY